MPNVVHTEEAWRDYHAARREADEAGYEGKSLEQTVRCISERIA